MSKEKSNINPLEGVSNLADAMLVFACGLMVALIVNWNVDVKLERSKIDLSKGRDVTGIDSIHDKVVEEDNSPDAYERMGTVYKDPKTGKLFMLTND
ncbi:MAG: DUF2149 domain-containing protein [Andreesenia angusta]|nr:DUF2149 domain-containing protein [Andreesenia angusta]